MNIEGQHVRNSYENNIQMIVKCHVKRLGNLMVIDLSCAVERHSFEMKLSISKVCIAPSLSLKTTKYLPYE